MIEVIVDFDDLIGRLEQKLYHKRAETFNKANRLGYFRDTDPEIWDAIAMLKAYKEGTKTNKVSFVKT